VGGAVDLPNSLTDRTAFLMQLALARAQDMGEDALVELGISGREYGVLAVLAHLQPCPQIRVGRALGVDRTTVLALVRGLLRRGLLRRDPDPADRRAYLVALTAEGEDVRARAAEVLVDCEQRFLAVLAPADRVRLAAALRTLIG
jgi:DNA-binding MarR family transcriptional regulator